MFGIIKVFLVINRGFIYSINMIKLNLEYTYKINNLIVVKKVGIIEIDFFYFLIFIIDL